MKKLFLLSLTIASLSMFAQESTPASSYKKSPLTESQLQRWSHLDLAKDSVPGMSVEKAYTELLKGKKGEKVVVAVIDSGVDTDHQDLANMIWTNQNEIPNNNIDDDNNGFIDDIHGWNFLGESNNENLELVRLLKTAKPGSDEYQKAQKEFDAKYKEVAPLKPAVDMFLKADKFFKEFLQKEDYTLEDLNEITSVKYDVLQNKNLILSFANQAGADFHGALKEFKAYVYDQLNYNLNKEFNGRKIVGDNPEDIKDTNYGNNDVYSNERNDSLHGSHVAGIIAQIRGNNLGGDGVCSNAVIMPIRAVPNGDEYDKDIALSIRYAVDNGAKVINGSFGKGYSSHPKWVWEALKYAEKKDVLIVFAAGNDSKNVDVEPVFPTDSKNKKKEIVNNVITIGALDYNYGQNMIADFSNYGSTQVDIFAPGVKIYATIPNNEYKYEQGTSMAAPNVAGVAALIRSYYPNLKASQVKEIIMNSGTEVNFDVVVGENQEKIPFSKTCVSGKFVNAYNALKLAEGISISSH